GWGGMGRGKCGVRDDGLKQTQAATAILLGPIDAGPAAGGHFAPPSELPLPFLFSLFRHTINRLSAVAGCILLKPGAKFAPKCFILFAVAEIHYFTDPLVAVAARSGCAGFGHGPFPAETLPGSAFLFCNNSPQTY